MINMRTHADRVQVVFWDVIINSLSKLRSLRTYRQEAAAPTLTLRKINPSRASIPANKLHTSMNARFFFLQWIIATLSGFLVGFLYSLLH